MKTLRKSASFLTALAGGASLAALVCGQPAFAQQAAQPTSASTTSGMEEVVVTARRKSEKLQDVPVAVTAISQQTLTEQQVVRVSDLAQSTPGFAALPSARGANDPTYTIRGQRGPNTETTLNDPAVAVYFAEVSQSRPLGANSALFDLDSVQILKGPQGTLFGRNSTGGAVLVEPAKPSPVFEGYGQVTLGDYNLHNFEGSVNVPINDKLAIRLAGNLSSRDGYMHSVVTGQNGDDLDSQSVRLSVRFMPTDDIDSNTIATFYHGGGVGEMLKLRVFDARGVPASLGAGRPIWIADELAAFNASNKLGPYQTSQAVFQGEYDRARSIQNNTTIDIGNYGFLGDLTVKNIIALKDIRNLHNGYDESGSSFTQFYYDGVDITSTQFSEELQLQGKNGNLDYVAGLYFFREGGHEIYKSNQLVYWANPTFQSQLAAAGLSAATAPLNGALPSVLNSNFNVMNQSEAAFIHGNYKLDSILEGLSLAGGVRVTNDYRSVIWHNISTGGLNPSRYVCTPTGAVLTSYQFSACSFGDNTAYVVPTYDMSLDWKVTPDLLLYVVSRYGYRAGGLANSPVVVNSVTGASYGPEYDRDVELGVKDDFNIDGVVGRVNLAVFHTWYDQVQETIGTIVNGAILSKIVNAASATIDGGELEVTLKPTDDIELNGSFAYIHPKFTNWMDNLRLASGAIVPIDLSDSRFGWLPYRQLNVSGQYTLPLPEDAGQATIRLTYVAQSGITTNNPVTNSCGPAVAPGALPLYSACINGEGNLPGYGIFKLRADWHNVLNHGFDMGFFVDNVLNTYYNTFAFAAIPQLGFSSETTGAPRMFGFQVRVPFGAKAYDTGSSGMTSTAAYVPPPVVAPKAAPSPHSYLVFFDFDKSDLTPQATQIVDQAAKNAGPAHVTRIEVTGHTDTVGSDAYNMRLSQRRAQSVAAELEREGVPAGEISLIAKGKRDLLVPTADGVREPQNRRVEIVYEGGNAGS